jgi:DNA-binding SARP family transcriptional activator
MEPRQEFEDLQRAVLSGLSECLAQKGHYTEAIETCVRALSLDGYGEELHRRLMLYHYCAGDQARALQAYRSYATMLEEELCTSPSPELTRLQKQIEASTLPQAPPAPEAPLFPEPHTVCGPRRRVRVARRTVEGVAGWPGRSGRGGGRSGCG